MKLRLCVIVMLINYFTNSTFKPLLDHIAFANGELFYWENIFTSIISVDSDVTGVNALYSYKFTVVYE